MTQSLQLTILRSLQASLRLNTKRKSVRTSLTILRNSSWAQLRLYSVHGTTLVQTFTVVTTISLIHGVLPLMYSQWHSVTWVTIAVQVLHLQEILLQVRRSSWVSSSSTHRAKTQLQVFVLLCQSLRWLKSSPKLSSSSRMFVRHSKTTTEICRTWSLLLKTRSSICSRQETVREQLRLLLKLLVTSLTRA